MMIPTWMSRPHGHRYMIGGFSLFVVLLLAGGCVDIRVPDPAVRYVAFGDSTTDGPTTRDYPDILRELLGEEPETFANEGHSGENSEDGLYRLEGLLAGEIFPNAEVLLYWQAGNDVTDFIKDYDPLLLFSPDDPGFRYATDFTEHLENTQANIEAAIATGQEADLQVYIATYFFLQENLGECGALPFNIIFPSQAQRANAYLARLNERIRAAATARGAVLVDVADLDDVIRGDVENYYDCNHLSEQGNAIVADLFFETIREPTP